MSLKTTRGSLQRHLLMASPIVILVAAFAILTGCGRQNWPTFSADDIIKMSFNIFYRSSVPTTRDATADEVRRFVDAYSAAEDYDDQAGTTHPVLVDILFKDGTSLRVWGGDMVFQTVMSQHDQHNIRSDELDRMLSEIADEVWPDHSGVKGKAMIVGGPYPGSPRPMSGVTVAVYEGRIEENIVSARDHPLGKVVVKTRADSMGAFTINLSPGTYTLVEISDAAVPEIVRVQPGEYSSVTLWVQAR